MNLDLIKPPSDRKQLIRAGIRVALRWCISIATGVLIVVGCAPSPPPSLAVVSAVPSVVPSATVDPRLSPARLEAARVFRTSAGLRSDTGWLRLVAVNAAAMEGERQFGVPLMPDEVTNLMGRAATADAVMTAIQAYGREHPGAWGGAYVETTTGRVVAMVVGDLDLHSDAVRRLVTPHAPLDLRSARWTLADLKALAHRIATDGWLARKGYDLISVGARIRDNQVKLELSSADPDAATATIARYAAGERLRVMTDGTGVLSKRRGGLAGFAIDAAGAPVPGLDVQLIPDVAGGPAGGDIGQETTASGAFRYLDLAPVGYTVKLLDSTGPDGRALTGTDRVLVGTAQVEIVSDQVVTVVIEVRR